MPGQNNAIKKEGTVRNARRIGGTRINDDWQYLEEENLSNNPTTDQIFNQSYKHQGLGERKITRNEEEGKENNNIVDLQNYRARIEQKRNIERLQGLSNKIANKPSISKIPNLGLNKIQQRKVLAVNRSILYWASYLWLFVQLPFAILGAVTLGAMGGLAALGESVSESNFLFKFVASIVSKTTEFLKDLVGFSPTDVIVALFFLFYIIVFTIGVITLLGTYLQHTLAMNKPLSGEGGGFKTGALLLAIIGYSVPLFNLLPWTLVWIFAISKYPR